MNDDKVRDLLIQHFQKPLDQGKRRHILFWYDKDRSYADFIQNLALDNIKIHLLTKSNNFITKKLLQSDDLSNHYLVYAPFPMPPDRDNWLANIIYYSDLFTLDDIALISGELGIKDPLLKEVIKKYLPFFKNKERFNNFKRLFDSSEAAEKNIELSMMAVLCKEKEATLENLIRSLFIKGFDNENKAWDDLVHFSLKKSFFHYVQQEYGFSSGNPTLKKLFISILLAALKHSFRAEFPERLKERISGEIKETTCYVFVDHWMKHMNLSERYNELAQKIEEELKLADFFKNFDDKIGAFIECDVFEFFDSLIINYLFRALLNHSEDYANLREIISARSATHWHLKFKDYYEAIKAAIDLFEFKHKYKNGFPRTTAYDMFMAYAKEYFKADQYYRRFYNAYDKVDSFDLLVPIRDMVEDIYDNSILQELSKQWSTNVKEELCGNWMISKIRHQKDFYEKYIPSLHDKRRDKVFVIISDALRYEAAEELTYILNKEIKLRGEAKLGFMLGCLPSYTKLGMACLLPHEKIELTEDAKIVIDGLPCSDTESRDKILKNYYKNSIAIQWEKMKSLPRSEVRELKKENRIFYIYHNIIDATGDKQISELKTFSSVTQAISELASCVRYIVNELSGTNIIITTDHGFLFKRTPLVESDKIELDAQKRIDSNKRFLLTSGDISLSGAVAISMKYLLGRETNICAYVPIGAQRFKIAGSGCNYVHGGASLQEIVLPVIIFKHIREKKEDITKKVEVKLTTSYRNITNNTFTLTFFQTEKVSQNRLPNSFNLALWDLHKNLQISDEKSIMANSATDDVAGRTYSVRLTLKGGNYDKYKDYYLMIRDREDKELIIDQIPFRINLGIINLF